MLYVLLLNPLSVFLEICRGDSTSRRMSVGSLTKIGLILVVLVLAKGDHCCCYEFAGLGLSRMLLGRTVMGKGEQYCQEQAEVQKEEYPALALGDEEQRRKKSGRARAPMVGADAAGHGDGVREVESESRLCREVERNPVTLTVCSTGKAYVVNGGDCQVVAGGRADNSP